MIQRLVGRRSALSLLCHAFHARTYSVCVTSKSSSRLMSACWPASIAVGPNTECHHKASTRPLEIDLPGERNVSVLGARVRLSQSALRPQLLPAIRGTDETDGSGQPWWRGGQRESEAIPLRQQHRRALVVARPRRIAAASVGEMGRQQPGRDGSQPACPRAERSGRAGAQRRATGR